MGKGTTKNTSNLGLVQPQQRSLRSRKREFPEEEIGQSSNNHTKHNPQDTEANNSTSAALPPCRSQPTQDTTKLSGQQGQTEEQATGSVQIIIAPKSCLAASACAEPVLEKAMQETDREKSVLTSHIEAGVLETLKTTQWSNHHQDKGEEAMGVLAHSRSSPTTPMDQRGSAFVAGEVEDVEGCLSLCHTGQLKEENGGNKTQSDKCSHQKSDPVCKEDDVSSEPVGVMPSKRRKRMGTSGLTGKERSHFLQTQKREKEKQHREAEEKRVEDGSTEDGNMELNEEKQCSHDESNLVAEGGNFVFSSPSAQPIPLGPFTKQGELEEEPLSPICEAVDSSGTGVHTSVTETEECSVAWNPIDQAPVCSELRSDNLTSLSKDCEQRLLSDIDVSFPTESAGSKDEAEKTENLMEDVEDTFEEPHHFPTTVPVPSILQNVLIESDHDHREEYQTSQQPMDSLIRTVGHSEMVEMDPFRHGAQPSPSFIDPGLGGSENNGKQPGADAAAPSGADENGNSGLDGGGGTVPSPVATQHPLDTATPDPFGFGSFDYISDSQLHTINLIEEQGGLIREDGGLCSSNCHEDATDLVRGLIRELSSLNRLVMATQRKVENLRRGNRGPKAY